jgi:hypothetical protein
MATTPLALSVIRPPLVDDLTQTGDDFSAIFRLGYKRAVLA